MKENKEMTPALIASAIALTKQYGIADSGDALSLGIGAMSEAKWQAIFDGAVAAGLYQASLDWRKGFTSEFVNQKHGLAMKK
jgi:NitT/TauT family transport system substrate-binding protein